MSQYPAASYLTGAYEARQFYADSGSEVAFAGRSNAGKSSAINTIVNRRSFARTSKSPGRTQLVNFFSLRPEQRLVDLPGYGFARVTREMQAHWRELLGSYFETRASLAGLFIIVDIRRGLGDYDAQMLEWSSTIGCPAHVLLTKADKLKRGPAMAALLAARKELGATATAQLFSATKALGVEEGRAALERMLQQHEPGVTRA